MYVLSDSRALHDYATHSHPTNRLRENGVASNVLRRNTPTSDVPQFRGARRHWGHRRGVGAETIPASHVQHWVNRLFSDR